jgi:hypothetical protein
MGKIQKSPLPLSEIRKGRFAAASDTSILTKKFKKLLHLYRIF